MEFFIEDLLYRTTRIVTIQLGYCKRRNFFKFVLIPHARSSIRFNESV